MRLRLTIAFLLLALPAYAGFINREGTSGAPKSVSTATKVIRGDTNRRSWCILPETVAIRCMTGGTDDTAASPVPSTTVGYFFPAGVATCDNSGFSSQTPLSQVARQRVDCTSTGAATNVDTWEEP